NHRRHRPGKLHPDWIFRGDEATFCVKAASLANDLGKILEVISQLFRGYEFGCAAQVSGRTLVEENRRVLRKAVTSSVLAQETYDAEIVAEYSHSALRRLASLCNLRNCRLAFAYSGKHFQFDCRFQGLCSLVGIDGLKE